MDYIINVGNTKSDIQPHECAEIERVAILRAQHLAETFKYVDVSYSPETDVNTDVLIWKNY